MGQQNENSNDLVRARSDRRFVILRCGISGFAAENGPAMKDLPQLQPRNLASENERKPNRTSKPS